MYPEVYVTVACILDLRPSTYIYISISISIYISYYCAHTYINLIVFSCTFCSGFPHQRFWNNRQRPGKPMQTHGPHLHRLRSKSLCCFCSLPRNLPGTELWRLGDREESGHCIISLYMDNRKLNGSITSPAFFYIGSQQTFALGLLLAILKSLCKCCSR